MFDLVNLFFANKPKDTEYYQKLFDNLNTYEPLENTVHALILSLRESRLLRKISLAAYEVNEKKKPREQLDVLLLEYNKEQVTNPVKEEDVFITDDLQELLDQTVSEPGLHWRLDWLNRALGPLRRGDFGFIFARPEAGKTTFLCSEASHMLKQTDKSVLWFN